MKPFFVRLLVLGSFLTALPVWAAGVRVYPAPAGEELSRDYAVEIEGQSAPVYAAKADPLRVELKGFDDTHAIENVSFQSVVVNGKPLTPADVRKSAFVRNVAVLP